MEELKGSRRPANVGPNRKAGVDVDLANKELGELKQQLFYGVKVTPGLALASGLADSQYDLSPAEKSDLRKRISSAESSISQKLSSIERLKRLTGTSTPETPAIPLTPIAKAEQSAQRGLLRKLEQTQTLARVKRQEGEQLRASSALQQQRQVRDSRKITG